MGIRNSGPDALIVRYQYSGYMWGQTNFRLIQSNTDYTSNMINKVSVKAWITSTCCLLWIDPPQLSGRSRQIIFCGEVDKIGEDVNTVMLLVYEYESEVGTRAVSFQYCDPTEETHFIHCLGDGHAYFPHTFGYGVSDYDGLIRPQTVILWRYTGAGSTQLYNLCWEIPSDVLRGTRFTGSEDDEDTFEDGGLTFIKVSDPAFASSCGGIYLTKTNWGTGTEGADFWFRRG